MFSNLIPFVYINLRHGSGMPNTNISVGYQQRSDEVWISQIIGGNEGPSKNNPVSTTEFATEEEARTFTEFCLVDLELIGFVSATLN